MSLSTVFREGLKSAARMLQKTVDQPVATVAWLVRSCFRLPATIFSSLFHDVALYLNGMYGIILRKKREKASA